MLNPQHKLNGMAFTQTDEVLWKGPRLIVPVTAEALVVTQNLKNNRWALKPMDYIQVGKFSQVIPRLTDTHIEPDTGITIHWALPDGLTHGVENDKGEIEFPFVPNRWLITRKASKSRSWILESDFLDISLGINAFLNPFETEASFTRIGQFVPLENWEDDTPAQAAFLQAISPGNVSFAAYTPNIKAVLSFHDDMQDLETQIEEITYMVSGWYSDPMSDPMFGKQRYGESGWQTEQEWKDLMSAHDWSVGNETDLDIAQRAFVAWAERHQVELNPDRPHDFLPAQIVCQGMVFGVQWPGKYGQAKSGVPTYDIDTKPNELPRVVVANTAVDALSALVEKELGQDEGNNAAEFMQAFQYNQLQNYLKPGGHLKLERAIHDAWFGSDSSGSIWQILAPGSPKLPDLNQDLKDQLRQLNADSVELSRLEHEVQHAQTALYALWWDNGKAKAWRSSHPSQFTQEEWDAIKERIKSELPVAEANASDLIGNRDEKAQVVQDLIDAISFELEQLNINNKLNLELRELNNARYHRANDPVILVYGAKREYKHGEDGRFEEEDELFCRFTGQQLYGIQVTDNEEQVVIDAVNIEIFAPPELDNRLPKELLDIYVESFFLDTLNAQAIADKACALLGTTSTPELVETIKKQQTLIWNSAKAPIDKHTVAELSGLQDPPDPSKLPSKVGVAPWKPPWSPLFIAWEIKWFPSARDPLKVLDDWTFDRHHQDYEWKEGKNPNVGDPVSFYGQSVLTPKSAVTLEAQLKEYFSNSEDFPDLQEFLDEVSNWDFLSQAMSGFTEELTLFESNQFNPPPDPYNSIVGERSQLSPIPDLEQTFFPLRSGHFRIEQIIIVDDFGQVFDPMADGGQKPGTFRPVIGEGMQTVGWDDLIQLPPRVMQDTKLKFELVSATEADQVPIQIDNSASPVCGWFLPNHIDKGFSVYDDGGHLLGEVLLVGGRSDKRLRWDTAPGQYTEVGHLLREDIRNDYMFGFLDALINHPDPVQAFDDLMAIVDETLWSVDPLGGRGENTLAVLVGRPIAVVRAKLEFELSGGPLFDQYWSETGMFNTHGYDTDVRFPIQLGSLQDSEDGLLGFFLNDDFTQLNSIHKSELPAAQPDYIINQPVTLPLSGERAAVTMLLDPRGYINVGSGILPNKALILPGIYVDDAMAKIEVTFRTGPLITDPDRLRMPLPSEIQGKWSWVQHSGITVWEETDEIAQANEKARLESKLRLIREGWLKLSDAFNENQDGE